MTKTKLAVLLTISFGFLNLQSARAQDQTPQPKPTPPAPAVSPTPKLSSVLAQNGGQQNVNISRERRQQAFSKLLEGQRYIWGIDRLRSQTTVASAARLAK